MGGMRAGRLTNLVLCGTVSRDQQSSPPLRWLVLALLSLQGWGCLCMGGVFVLEVVLVVPHTLLQEKKQA